MFNNLGWEEILVLAVIGLIVIGPERLPKAIHDLGAMLRQLRTMARGAANDLKAELGPEMADLDLRSLNPRRFVEDALFGDDNDPASADVAAAAAQPLVAPGVASLATNERPPYDPDAT